MNRAAKTVFEVFDNILSKERLSKQDIGLIIDKIFIFTDKIEVYLKADIDELLKITSEPYVTDTEGNVVNFKQGTKLSIASHIAKIRNSKGDELSVNTISGGDPLEIYTSSDGEVVFKKYSPVGELDSGTSQAAEVIAKLTGNAAIVFDRDHVVAVSGARKTEYAERRLSPALEELIEQRKSYAYDKAGTPRLFPIEGLDKPALVAVPIISSGDVIGAVALIDPNNDPKADEKNIMLAKAAAMFLGKQIEN